MKRNLWFSCNRIIFPSACKTKSIPTPPWDCWWAGAHGHHGPAPRWCWWRWGARAAIRSSPLPGSPRAPRWPASPPHSCFWCKTRPGRAVGTLSTWTKERALEENEKRKETQGWEDGRAATVVLCWLRHHNTLLQLHRWHWFHQSVQQRLVCPRRSVMTRSPSGARWQMTSQHRESDVTLAPRTSAERSAGSVHIVLHVPWPVNKPLLKHEDAQMWGVATKMKRNSCFL